MFSHVIRFILTFLKRNTNYFYHNIKGSHLTGDESRVILFTDLHRTYRHVRNATVLYDYVSDVKKIMHFCLPTSTNIPITTLLLRVGTDKICLNTHVLHLYFIVKYYSKLYHVTSSNLTVNFNNLVVLVFRL